MLHRDACSTGEAVRRSANAVRPPLSDQMKKKHGTFYTSITQVQGGIITLSICNFIVDVSSTLNFDYNIAL